MEEFKEILNTYLKDFDSYKRGHEIHNLFCYKIYCERLSEKLGVDVEFIAQEGGGEGEGEYCYGVIRFKDKYFKAEWCYYSYDGEDFDGIEDTIFEVKPVQRLVTFYE